MAAGMDCLISNVGIFSEPKIFDWAIQWFL
jgi:hypothetical protein